MENNKNIDKELQQLRDRFEMNPPENAWNLLDADLERKQAIRYKRSRNRFKTLSICLALMLLLFITYYCYYPPNITQKKTDEAAFNSSKSNEKQDAPEHKKASIPTNNTENSTVSSTPIHTPKKGEDNLDNSIYSIKTSSFSQISGKNKLESVENKGISKDKVAERYNKLDNSTETFFSNHSDASNTTSQSKAVIPKNKVTTAMLPKTNGTTDYKKGDGSSDAPKSSGADVASIKPNYSHLPKKTYRNSTADKTIINKEKTQSISTNQALNDGHENGKSNVIVPSESTAGNPKENDTPIPSIADSTIKSGISKVQLTDSSLVKVDSSNLNAKKDSLVAKNNRKTSRFSIAAFYAPNYFTGLHLVTNSSYHSYGYNSGNYTKNNQTQYSYAAGIIVKYDLTSRIGLTLGGTYSTLAYSMVLSTIYARYGANWQLHYMYPTPCGNIEIPNTSNTTLHYGDSIKAPTSCSQVLKFVSIPITIRYQLTNNRLKLFADAGVSANFVLQEKADITIGATQYNITNNITGLQKINYGYLLGFGVEYGFHPHLNIFMEPSFRGSISSLTQKTSYYCYPYSFNRSTGLSYHF